MISGEFHTVQTDSTNVKVVRIIRALNKLETF